MKITDCKRYLNREVLLTESRHLSKPTKYKLSGVIMRREGDDIVYSAELLDLQSAAPSLLITSLDAIEGESK